MPRQKGQTKRKGAARSSKKDDLVTVQYSTIVFYVLVGLIIGMAIGALALLYVARAQTDTLQAINSTQGQLLRSSHLR